ncbi:hypothetical protein AB0I10_01190 [Streptomyces sp. NPDC050636]|uniref:hypothetical protein n=1 Tax=Streptomyces sp. NPDC050636 TaxID=3154510 RepID=UPI00341AD7CE
MKQRMRTGIGTRMTTRTGTRALAAAGLALATVTTVGGCAFPSAPKPPLPSPTDTYSLGDPTGYPSDTYSPSPSPTEESYDPDGRSDVNASNCDFSETLHKFTYTVSITNPSTSDSYSYDMDVRWMKDKPADGTMYGQHERSIVVSPGETEEYTAEYTVNQSTFARFWFTCEISEAQKSRM